MKTISDFKESIALLEQYQCAYAQIWAFNISLKRLLLKLSKSSESEVVYLIVVGCEHIIGPFSWKNAQILISKGIDKITSETITTITDKAAGFELISSGGFTIVQGLDTEFDKSFINFSGDSYNVDTISK